MLSFYDLSPPLLADHTPVVDASLKLLPHLVTVPPAEQERILAYHLDFARRWANILMCCCPDYERIMADFESFMQMKDFELYRPNIYICFMWHAAMQDPALYKRLCMQLGGRLVLAHCVRKYEEDELQERHKRFCADFEDSYKRKPYAPGRGGNLTLEEVIKKQKNAIKFN